MQTIGVVLRTVDHEIHLGWQHIRSWAESAFTRERKAEIVFISVTLALCAVLLFCLLNAVQNFTITYPSDSLSFSNWQQVIQGI